MKKEKKSIRRKYKEIAKLYDELIYSQKVRNQSIYAGMGIEKTENESDLKMKYDFLGTYEGTRIVYYYVIDKLPETLNIGWKEMLRAECTGGTRVVFVSNLRHHKIMWESPELVARLRVLRQVRQETAEKDIDAYNMYKNIADMDKQRWIEDSLLYLSEAEKLRHRVIMKTTQYFLVSGERGEDFDDTVAQIENDMQNMGIQFRRLMYDIPSKMQRISPFKYSRGGKEESYVPVQVMTDEIFARFSTYTQGVLGEYGEYFGTDILSGFPVFKRVKQKNTSAENILVTAETGGGKSYFVKALILQLLGRGVRGTIMDIEGYEYIKLAEYLERTDERFKVLVLNMGEGFGKYIDPVAIFPPSGVKDIDREAKKYSMDFTLAVLKVLLGKVYHEDVLIDGILNDAVAQVYLNAGVTDDPTTWGRSKGLDLHSVYRVVQKFRKDKSEEYAYQDAVLKVERVLQKYFEPEGTRSYLFREKMNIEDLNVADLVLCTFGMAGKAMGTVDDVLMGLMQLNAAQISHRRSIYSKSIGKFNFKVWEEVQRWGKFPGSESTLGTAITGGRKLGDINIIITNVLKELLEDDKFNIFGNVTSFLIGAIGDEKLRYDVCDRLTMPKLKGALDRISLKPRSKRKKTTKVGKEVAKKLNPFEYGFLCGLDRETYGVVRMIITKGMEESGAFETGVDEV